MPQERLRAIVGAWFAALRDRSGLSQEAFAARVGMTRTNLSAVENGHQLPGDDLVAAACEAFRVPPPMLTTAEAAADPTDAVYFAGLAERYRRAAVALSGQEIESPPLPGSGQAPEGRRARGHG